MKTWMAFVGLMAAVQGIPADPLTLINLSQDRPIFSYQTAGWTQTRTVAPGNRVALEPGTFSGLGEKKVDLAAGGTYYVAHFTAITSLYRLPADQVLVYNQSGRVISLTLNGKDTVSAPLASGNFALGAKPVEGQASLEWDDGAGNRQTQELKPGTVYRLLLASPDGVGTTVSLAAWD